jgi:hypothetical protein
MALAITEGCWRMTLCLRRAAPPERPGLYAEALPRGAAGHDPAEDQTNTQMRGATYMLISAKILVTATASCLVIAMPVGAAAQTDLPVLGTIGIDLPQRLETIQDAAQGELFEGPSLSWNLSVNDTVVPRMISDFDDDGLDDFIIHSGWGFGIIGNANGQLVAKAATPYEFPIGTSMETEWILSPGDEVVAVGRFGRLGSSAGEMVLKGARGFAFVGANKQRGILEARTVVPYGTRLFGDGLS